MTREQWLEIEKKYTIARSQGFLGSQNKKGIPSESNWQADVIQLLTAICEELWQLRQTR
jgi:hypothetical protein